MSYKLLNRSIHRTPAHPVRILQFGEGNFLRAFADWMIDRMNKEAGFDAGVIVVQPIDKGMVSILKVQEGFFTVYLNGIKSNKAVSEHTIIDCIQAALDPYEQFTDYLKIADNPDLRFVISNTTEAGIAYQEENQLSDRPPASFPAKLTLFLFHRFEAFDGAQDKGLIFLPCELIDRNGDNLKRIILQYAIEWGLSEDFLNWIENHNIFTNTLVDRIVPGYPESRIKEITTELGYEDKIVVEGEQFHLWVIEGPDSIKAEFPSEVCGLNVVFTDNMEPYRTRKVRILNGAHTMMVPVAYLYGIDYVRESVEDTVIGQFIRDALFDEICPTLDLPNSELKLFANDVLDRFRNPYLQHSLMAISLNSISKFRTRVLPSLLEYLKRKNTLPVKLCFSFAALMVFYKGQVGDKRIALRDDPQILDFTSKTWSKYDGTEYSISVIAKSFLNSTDFWGQDLTAVPGLEGLIRQNLRDILTLGVKEVLNKGEIATTHNP